MRKGGEDEVSEIWQRRERQYCTSVNQPATAQVASYSSSGDLSVCHGCTASLVSLKKRREEVGGPQSD